jgi:hypothetical protein
MKKPEETSGFFVLSSGVRDLAALITRITPSYITFRSASSSPGKRASRSSRRRNHILPPLRALPDDAAIAQDAPVVGHRRLGDILMAQCVAALLAAIGQDANDLEAHRVTKGKSTFSRRMCSRSG